MLIVHSRSSGLVDVIKGIKDPEKPQTLEELDVLSEESVKAEKLSDTLLHATGWLCSHLSYYELTMHKYAQVNLLVSGIIVMMHGGVWYHSNSSLVVFHGLCRQN